MTAASSSSRFERSGSTVRVAADGARIALTVCSTRIVRVALEDGTPDAAPSYVGERSWPAVPWELSEGKPLRLTTADLGVELTGEPARLSFLDTAGQWLLREAEHGGLGSGPGGCRVHAAFQFSDGPHFFGAGASGA